MTTPNIYGLPGISCICPTYNRYPERGWLLEECVESFLRQTYQGPKELLILNDAPSQVLVCDATGVKIINYGERFKTLGAKYNRLVMEASHSLLVPFEDDDISLPWRLSLSVERLGGYEYFNPKSYFFQSGSILQHEQGTGYAHSCSMFTKAAWYKVGGYPEDKDGCKQDAVMDTRLRRMCRVSEGPLPPSETFYLYRFGVSDHHVSAYGNPEEAYREYGTRPIVKGRFEIKPRWREDYVETVRNIGKRG